jgi:hypothetical protein
MLDSALSVANSPAFERRDLSTETRRTRRNPDLLGVLGVSVVKSIAIECGDSATNR